MENWENKIIADKLNSLEELPQNYSPNLNSKWEIIRQSLPEKRGIHSIKKWSAGLLLMLLIALIVWKFYPVKETDAVTAISETAIATTNHKQTTTTPLPEKAVPVKENKETKKTYLQAKPSTKPLPNTKRYVEHVMMENRLPASDSFRIQKDTIKALAPIAEMKQRPNKKVYQKDFAGINNSIDTNATKIANKKFEVRFNFRNDKNTPAVQSPSLRLTQNF